MKKINILIVIALLLVFVSCKKEETPEFANVSFKFTFNWDGDPVELSDFNDIKYTNEFGNELSIIRLRYLLSNITFVNDSGEDYTIDGYNLTDLENQVSLTYAPEDLIPTESYSSLSFTFGFDETDNAQSYADLNTVNFDWPDPIGGGYHFMQFDGKFINSDTEQQSFNYHMGTAKVSDGEFEPNHFTVNLDGVDLTNDAEIEIKMNIAEWFKNPYLWDLNVFNQMLMPNYEAQKKMLLNGPSVFTLGTVTQ